MRFYFIKITWPTKINMFSLDPKKSNNKCDINGSTILLLYKNFLFQNKLTSCLIHVLLCIYVGNKNHIGVVYSSYNNSPEVSCSNLICWSREPKNYKKQHKSIHVASMLT